MVDLRRSGKFPQKFENDGVTWEVLKRNGLWILCKGVPSGGMGPVRYSVCSVCQGDAGELFARPGITVTDLDRGSVFLDLKLMTEIFEKKASEERGREVQASLKAKADALKNEQIMSWRQKIDAIRMEQSNLIDSLKKDCLADNLNFINAKKTREVCSRLAEIEQFLHHAKPREVGAI